MFETHLLKTALSPAIWIGALPVLLHLVDKMLEFFSPLGDKSLCKQMNQSPQQIVKEVGSSFARFESVKAYFEYQKTAHFITSITIFNILSIYVANIESTCSFSDVKAWFVVGMLVQFAFLTGFIVTLLNGRIHPAQVRPRGTRHWERAAFGCFILIVIIEVILKSHDVECKFDVPI